MCCLRALHVWGLSPSPTVGLGVGLATTDLIHPWWQASSRGPLSVSATQGRVCCGGKGEAQAAGEEKGKRQDRLPDVTPPGPLGCLSRAGRSLKSFLGPATTMRSSFSPAALHSRAQVGPSPGRAKGIGICDQDPGSWPGGGSIGRTLAKGQALGISLKSL